MNPSFLNLFMKKFTRVTGRPDHLRENFLRYFRQRALRSVAHAVLCEKQEGPGQALLGGVEELVIRSSSMRIFLFRM